MPSKQTGVLLCDVVEPLLYVEVSQRGTLSQLLASGLLSRVSSPRPSRSRGGLRRSKSVEHHTLPT